MIRRRSNQNVLNALGRQAAVVLLGARQVGKTTLALDIAENADAVYLDLESRADREKLAEPALYLDEYEDRLVILDEIHRAPELFQELRGLIDRGRRRGKRTGRFLILGSASLDLLRQSGESLAGRIEYVELDPARRKRSRARRAGHDVAMGTRWFSRTASWPPTTPTA